MELIWSLLLGNYFLHTHYFFMHFVRVLEK